MTDCPQTEKSVEIGDGGLGIRLFAARFLGRLLGKAKLQSPAFSRSTLHMFRNLRFYRLHGEWPSSEQALSDQLASAAFKPCGSLSERSYGWEPPAPELAEFCRRVAGCDLLRLRTQSRVLPVAAINEALVDRVETFKTRMERDPGRREKRELKEAVYTELLPQALLKSERTLGCYLSAENVLAIDSASEPVAERFLEQLREALGSLKVTPLAFNEPMAQMLTRIFLGDGPSEFVVGRECLMQDPVAGNTRVNWMDIDLADTLVRRHVQTGLKLERLAVEFDHLLSCVVDENAVVRKLKLSGTDAMDDVPSEEPLARLDAEFVMSTGALQRLLGVWRKRLGGYAA